MAAIVRHRGDTWPAIATLTRSDGSVRDLTGCTNFFLSVNRVPNPTGIADQVFEVAGSIAGDPLNGQASFPVPIIDPDTYYYNIEMTDESGYVRTPLSGVYLVHQDITKSDSEFTVSLGGFAADGVEVYLDGDGTDVSTLFWALDDRWKYKANTRDAVEVFGFYGDVGSPSTPGSVQLLGTEAQQQAFKPWVHNIEAELLVYIDDAVIACGFQSFDGYSFLNGGVRHTVGSGVRASWTAYQVTPGPIERYDEDAGTYDAGAGAGWYRLKTLIEKNYAALRVKFWADGDDEPDWAMSWVPLEQPSVPWMVFCNAGWNGNYKGTEIAEAAELTVRTWK